MIEWLTWRRLGKAIDDCTIFIYNMIIVRSKFVSVVFARVDGESTLSAVFLVLPACSTQSPTLAASAASSAAAGMPTSTRPRLESPLPLHERTLDCTEEISIIAGSKWPLEPLRVVPTDPEFPGPPPIETDSGPARSVATVKSPLAAVTDDLTGNSVESTTEGTSSGLSSLTPDISAL